MPPTMQKYLLKLYDKILLALLLGLFAFTGCSTKRVATERKLKTGAASNISIQKPDTNKVVAMYGAPSAVIKMPIQQPDTSKATIHLPGVRPSVLKNE
jgi:hypothetical protein